VGTHKRKDVKNLKATLGPAGCMLHTW